MMKTLLIMMAIIFASTIQASTAIEAFEKKDYQLAKQLFQEHSDKAEANLYLGRIALVENELDEAEEYLELAVEQKPKNADYNYWFALLSVRQASNASIFSAPGYASDAKKYYQTALAIEPTHVNAMQGLISFYINAPGIAGGSFKKAVLTANQLQEIDEKLGLIAHINIMRKQEKTAQEILLAEELVAKYNHSPKVLVKVGFTYQYARDYDKAMTYFERASQIDSEDESLSASSALYQVGRTAVLSKQYTEKGISALEHYLKGEEDINLPDFGWARYRLAALYLSQGDKERAKSLAEIAIQSSTDKNLRKNAKKLLKRI